MNEGNQFSSIVRIVCRNCGEIHEKEVVVTTDGSYVDIDDRDIKPQDIDGNLIDDDEDEEF